MTPLKPSRRGLLGAAAAFSIVPRRVLGGPGYTAPSEKLNIAGIGIGGVGAANLRNLEAEDVVALCDVDQTYAAPIVKKYPKAEFFTDYRVLLDRRKDVDGVLIATPDHTHAVIAMAALRAGKHVYCQKPLTHDIHEARTLAAAARQAKVATQMGIQGHSGEGIRLLSEWVAAGVLGEVREVVAWCSLSYYPWGHASWSSKWSERPREEPSVPAGVDWDLWLGPAPERPYHRAYHPRTWRCWWDFGSGMMGDRGVHTLDPIVTALGLTAPTTVEATSCGGTTEVHPVSAVVTFDFPARGTSPPVKLTWYEGIRAPRPPELEPGRALPAEGGAIVRGSKATVVTGVTGMDPPPFIPASRGNEIDLPPKSLPRVPGSHEQDWIRAARTGQPAGADFTYAAALTEICLLGNVAKRLDDRITWDAAAMKVTSHPTAEALVRVPYRKGWSL